MSKIVVSINSIESDQDLKAVEQVLRDIHEKRVSGQGFFLEVFVVVTTYGLSSAGYGVLRRLIASIQEQGAMVHAMITSSQVGDEVIMAVCDADALSINENVMVDISPTGINPADWDHHPDFQQSLRDTLNVVIDGGGLTYLLREQLFAPETGKELKTMICVPTYYSTMVESYRNIVTHYNVGDMDPEGIKFSEAENDETEDLVAFTDEIEQRLQA